jgi:hypothetical protein
MAEETGDIRSMMQAVIQEFVKADQSKAEPAHKALRDSRRDVMDRIAAEIEAA